MFEVELRGLLTKQDFTRLKVELATKPSQNDDKMSVFFTFPQGILKVVERAEDGEVKLCLKLGDETSNSLHERDIRLAKGTLADTVSVLEHIGYKVKSRVKQTRTNYKLEEGVELALKHTDSWGYHFEIEMLVQHESEIDAAKAKLHSILAKLGVKAMSQDELTAFLAELDAKSISHRVNLEP